MNILVITGNVTKDTQVRYTQNSKAVLSFDVANNQGYGDNKRTEYYQCSIWGDRAEKLQQYIQKGTSVTVTGEHSTEKSDCGNYFNNKVFVREIDFKTNQQPQAVGRVTSPQQQPQNQGQQPPANDFDDSNIPF